MCDFCENIKNYDEYGNHWFTGGVLYNPKEKEYCLVQNDSEYDFNDYLDINFCPLCGRELSEENHSDPFRQMLKEVAEEMPVLGKYDGDYAFHYGTFGYIEDGLYKIDFTCSNCGKRHEGVFLGNDVTCECGKIIRTGLSEETEND